MNEYELSYELPHSGVGGIHKDVIGAAAEMDARAILRAKFGSQQEVRIISGRQTYFGGGRDDDRHDRR